MRDPITKLVLCWCWVVVRRVPETKSDEVVNAAAFSDYAGKLLASKNPDGVFLFWCLVMIQLVVELSQNGGKCQLDSRRITKSEKIMLLEYFWSP